MFSAHCVQSVSRVCLQAEFRAILLGSASTPQRASTAMRRADTLIATTATAYRYVKFMHCRCGWVPASNGQQGADKPPPMSRQCCWESTSHPTEQQAGCAVSRPGSDLALHSNLPVLRDLMQCAPLRLPPQQPPLLNQCAAHGNALAR